MGFVRTWSWIPSVPVVLTAAAAGLLITQPTQKATALLALLMIAAVGALVVESPILGFTLLAVILAAASEELVDDRLLGVSRIVHGTSLGGVSITFGLLLLVVFALAIRAATNARMWPGAPATVLVALVGIATASAVLVGPVSDNIFIVRPLYILLFSTLCGYWVVERYGVDLPVLILVGAAGVAIPIGLYNSFSTGLLSYYDSSYIYFIGLAATIVVFRAVDIGALRIPFIVLSALVIVLSFRRGAMIAVAITLVVTGLVSGRAGFRAALAVGAACVLVVELVSPGMIYDQVERAVTYFTGSSGRDENVTYRTYETANAWLNVKSNPVWGIGPTTDWIVYRTFDGRFRALGPDYLHNSYLWVWLRYSVVGLFLLVAFIATSAGLLIRRSAPIVSLAVGSSMLGLAVTLITASSLTTTTRWPLMVGLFLGIALAAKSRALQPAAQPLTHSL